MEKEILSRVDHTLLGVSATWNEIKEILDDSIKYGVASACIPPSYVKRAKEYVGNNLKICTVIGFPNGYNTKNVKIYETVDSIENGADEIDMVINIGDVKNKNYDKIMDEIKSIKKICPTTLKVIIETCLLTQDEKIKLCEIVSHSGADFIKTSTGFSTGGATFEDISLMAKHTRNIGIKASGGISSLDDAKKYLDLGATRLGTSKIVKIIKQNSK